MAPDTPSGRTRADARAAESVSEVLYQAALRRLREDGFEATPISAVTREAKVAKGTFFNYFPTKEHLLARAFDEMTDLAVQSAGSGGDAIFEGLDRLALELAKDPKLAGAIVPRLGLLPPLPPAGAAAPSEDGEARPHEEIAGPERIRRWIRDRLAEAGRDATSVGAVDDQTLSVLLLAAFEATLREWVAATAGEPPFPRRLLHGRVAHLLVSGGFSPPAPPR